MGGELCMPNYTMMKAERVTALETVLDEWNDTLTPLKEFILPGGSRAAPRIAIWPERFAVVQSACDAHFKYAGKLN
jgi:cob(I)alamin adenosyltransferase